MKKANERSVGDLVDPLNSVLAGRRSEAVGVLRADGEYRLVTLRSVDAGERLFRMEGEEMSRPSRYSVQLAEDLHLDLEGGQSMEEILDRYYWRFMNHSCEPNSCIRERDVYALRAVEPWENVTFDYNTTEYEMAEPFECRCASRGCLKQIGGFKHLTDPQRRRIEPLLIPYLRNYLHRPLCQAGWADTRDSNVPTV